MAIYITGDTHGDFQRFGSKYFPTAEGDEPGTMWSSRVILEDCGMEARKINIGWTG